MAGTIVKYYQAKPVKGKYALDIEEFNP